MYQYAAKLNRVVDGDTVDLDVDLGFMVTVLVRFRLDGIDAPELKKEQLEAGKASKARLNTMLEDADMGIIRVDSSGRDKYGRWVAKLSYVSKSTGNVVNVCEQMISEGFAKEYIV